MAETPVVPVPTTPAPSIPSPAQLESPSTTTGNSLLQPLQNLALDPSTAPSLAEACTREEGKVEEQEEDGEEEEEEVEVEPPPLEKTAEQVRIQELEQELADMKAQRDKTKRDFDGVIVKVTKMRDVFTGDLAHERAELAKSREEADELREVNDSLLVDVETLQSELRISNEEAEAAHAEAARLRKEFDLLKSSSDEASSREGELNEALEDLERATMDREEWEAEAMRERVKAEELVVRLGQVEMELAGVKAEREQLRDERDREAESAANLHAVLEEFQVAKERELKSTLGDLQTQLETVNGTLNDYRTRATTAETRLAAALNDSEKVFALAKEIREKNLIIGKLRHEAVILNEHLTEALRRLKKDAIENSVDRRLVSNVLITFLTTARGDPKRFEILQLLSSILSWTDDQREQVGLQRSSGLLPVAASSPSGSRPKGHSRGSKASELDESLGETETFSNLWIEFLLKEVSQAEEPSPVSPGGTSQRFNLADLPPISPGLSTPSRTMSSSSLTSFYRSNSNGVPETE